MRRLFVKVCGLRTLEAVDAAIDAGADALGFVFAESVRRVLPDEAAALVERAGGRARCVAVFRHPTPGEVGAALDAAPFDLVQTDAEDFDALDFVEPARRLPVVRTGNGFADRVRDALGRAAWALVEGPRSGAGEPVDTEAVARLDASARARVILAGGLTPATVGDAVARTGPLGVDVSSGVERAPGEKDLHLIRQFVRAARDAERITS